MAAMGQYVVYSRWTSSSQTQLWCKFLAHLSWEVKWVFLITFCFLQHCQRTTFSTSYPKQWVNFKETLYSTKHPSVKGFQPLKIFSTNWPISTKLKIIHSKHPYVKWFVYLNDLTSLFVVMIFNYFIMNIQWCPMNFFCWHKVLVW